MSYPKSQLEYALLKCKPIMDLFFHGNCVVGGKLALRLHGLKMSTIAADLDIIIFQPMDWQLRALEHLKAFDKVEKNKDYDNMAMIKVMKFQIGGQSIDIILEPAMLPFDLLCINIASRNWPINSISNVIDAKISYAWNRKSEDGLHMYMRSKDLLDLIDFKNCNFNVPNWGNAGNPAVACVNRPIPDITNGDDSAKVFNGPLNT